MRRERVEFENKEGQTLEGFLDFPETQKPHNFVLFAHCFTCSKNLTAVSNISRALTNEGFGVLRFDFTGLGESEGDFSDTNFSSNVDDLIAAAHFLGEKYQAPTVLVGHSLGGAASIFAADRLASVKAVATIGAPSDPMHVKRLLESATHEIDEKGEAKVNLEGRSFLIKKQFIEDLENKNLTKVVRHFGKALLVMHSPQDRIVGIENAEEIYKAAFHPKSYVSLDGADHLLTQKADSLYVGKVIGTWASRYVDIPVKETRKSSSQVIATLDARDGFTTYINSNNHSLIADEPLKVGGNDFGPNPYDYVATGLAACTVMTVMMYANRKKWDVKSITVEINHSKDYAIDCEKCDQPTSKIDTFTKYIHFEGDLNEEQIARLMEISSRCPVHRTLISEIQIISHLKE